MRVFVSSTFFDLIDVRAEVAELLRELDIVPVMSDDKLSDFEIRHPANSIQKCLLNVESCDEVIFILNQRYGPRLGESGFDNVSATHLEFQHATEKNIPVRFFVRDRLDADYSIWKKNGRSTKTKLAWIGESDVGLFDLLEQRKKLDGKSSRDNWYWNFTNLVDLKAVIRRLYEQRTLSTRLADAIHRNTFPMFDVKMDVEQMDVSGPSQFMMGGFVRLKAAILALNVGGAAAFNVRIWWEGDDSESPQPGIIAAGRSTDLRFIFDFHPNSPFQRNFQLEFESVIGVGVSETYSAGIRSQLRGSAFAFGVSRTRQVFRQIPELCLPIERSPMVAAK